jgi:hypothetical protein
VSARRGTFAYLSIALVVVAVSVDSVVDISKKESDDWGHDTNSI